MHAARSSTVFILLTPRPAACHLQRQHTRLTLAVIQTQPTP